jgi:hypothetical protein
MSKPTLTICRFFAGALSAILARLLSAHPPDYGDTVAHRVFYAIAETVAFFT